MLTLLAGVASCGPLIVDADTLPRETDFKKTVLLTAEATNSLSTFRQYMYSFPLASTAALTTLTGSVSILSDGEGFAEALFSVDDVPSGERCPVSGESFGSYAEIRSHYPGLRTLARFIVKEPRGSRVSSMPTNLNLPKPFRVSRCLVVILDGAVLRVGGPLTMSSNIVARFTLSGVASASASLLEFGDEFCFDRESGCELATLGVSPQMAFIKVVPIKQPAVLMALYGDISDSAFGWGGAKAPTGRWIINNSYYLYPKCSLMEGLHGPADYFAQIPAGATKLFSLEMSGSGQRALQQPVFQNFHGTALNVGDCLIHIVRMTASATLGGVDAESQIMALVESTAKQ